MVVEMDKASHREDFVRLNELWITEHFSLGASDRLLAADPFKIVRDGGQIFSMVENGQIQAVCALFKDAPQRYQLARMAVEPSQRGKGYGDILIRAEISKESLAS